MGSIHSPHSMNKANTPTGWDIFLVTGFYAGFSPVAPGTAGAALATLLWGAAVWSLPYAWVWGITCGGILLFTLLAIPSIRRIEQVWGEDPSRVVIDEMVGVWITLLAVPQGASWLYPFGAFFLFRLFDIWKPLGVRRMERISGGWGVMLDDILAGLYGAIVMMGIQLLPL